MIYSIQAGNHAKTFFVISTFVFFPVKNEVIKLVNK